LADVLKKPKYKLKKQNKNLNKIKNPTSETGGFLVEKIHKKEVKKCI